MIVTRFAPSPTGFLHIGGLRTALFAWSWARKNSGKFLLRIEDTDLARNSDEATKKILEAFEWVGMSHDGEIEYQSKRFDIYKKYIDKLLAEDKAYYCYMTKVELDALRDSQIANKERPRYDGRYRDGKLPPVEGVSPVVRIKAPQNGKIVIDDGVKGKVVFEWDEVDDFVIARGDGAPTYNFVVAIDDALMGVTDVIRGDDHLSNTPKQIAVYEALGFDIPRFFHVPMIHNDEGKKLSKRDGATDVMEYKTLGFLPEALLNFLIRLGWSYGDQELFSMDEIVELFDPNNINKSASAYNQSKLLWINAQHIKKADPARLIGLIKDDFGVDLSQFARSEMLLKLASEKAQTLRELADEANKFLTAPTSYNEKDLASMSDEAVTNLRDFVAFIEGKSCQSAEEYQVAIDKWLKLRDLKMPNLGRPLRIALFGSSQGPNLSDSLAILQVEECKKRVEKLASSR